MRVHTLTTRITIVAVVALFAAVLAASAPDTAQTGSADRPAYSFAEPGISPDGREIAFVSGGDIWTVPATGGEARLLVVDPETESRPLFSPDGRELAFVSERTGGGDIYVLALDSGTLRRLTWDDGRQQLDGWSRDGRWIYFSSTSHDIAGMNDIYRVQATGGTPMRVSEDRYVNEFGAAPSPNGRELALVARGNGSSQWWRNGSSHLDKSEIWLRRIDADGLDAYTQLTPRDAKHEWPMWDADGRTLFYVADRGGAENLWSRPASAGGRDRKLTDFRAGRVLWPSITADGKTIAFERDFGIWTLDTATGQARPVSITRRGAPSMPAPERLRLTSQFSDLALSPDGRKVAFIARGEVFAGSARDGGEATRVTATLALESQPVWSADSRKLVYSSARDGGEQLYLYDFTTSTETALTTGAGVDVSPTFSPDGRSLAFLRDQRELRVIDLETGEERLLSSGTFGAARDRPAVVWSPDGQWLGLFTIGQKMFKNVELVPVAGGARRAVSYLANTFADALAWSPDGTFLLFNTRQRTEQAELARVDLVQRTPRFREDLFRDLFNEPTPRDRRTTETRPAAPPAVPEPREAPAVTREPVTPVFAGIRERLAFLPVGLDVGDVVISPDGKTALVVGSSGNATNLYTWSLDELATGPSVARQITTSTGGKADPQFTPDGREIYYLEGGRIQIATVERRESRPLNVTAELVVDFADDRLTVFDEAWTLMRDNFYDPAFHGVDWSESRAVYRPRAAAATTRDELRRIISLMVGDLNASHLGISGGGGGGGGGGLTIGRLGLRFDRRDYETSGRLRITAVVPLGPAALTGEISEGDVLAAVNGRALGAGVNLNERLAGTSGRKVTLSLVREPGGATRDVVVQPTSQGTEKSLLYRAWVAANREYVLKTSGGRLGYVHMLNMSEGALDQLYIDLDAENHMLDGVVIDVRNNSGGFVNAYALDVFTRRPYLRMSIRGLPEAPARSVLGQRSLESPTVLVTNQHSLSDAEDFTEGYRTLKLGSVVGEPTAGWIIYTWNARLVDGSSFRLPRMKVVGADGRNMELVPRPVDVEVTRPLGETSAGRDTQLDEAIRVLLRQIGRSE